MYSLDTKPFEQSIARAKQIYADFAKIANAKPPALPAVATPRPSTAIPQQQRQLDALRNSEIGAARAAGDHARALQIIEGELNRASTGTVRYNQLLAQQSRAQTAVARQGGGGPALPRTLDGLSGSAATVLKGFLSIQAIERGFQFVKTGAEVADVTTSFTNLSKAAGTTGTALLTSLRAASNSTITDAALIKSANLGLLLTQGRIAKDLPALTQIAQASAKATGQSVEFVFESLVKGISRGSAKIIDNAGITLDGEKAYNDYAKSIGKSADQLTKAEQQQAVLNAVVKEGNQIVKDAGINADDASVKIAAAETAVQNLLTALATKAAPVAGSIAGGITNLINTGGVAPGAVDAGNAVDANLLSKGQDYAAYAAGVAKVNDELAASFKGDPVLGFYAKMRLGLEALTPAQFAYAQSLIATGTPSDAALQKAQVLADVSTGLGTALRSSTFAAATNRTELTALGPKIFEVASQSDHNRTAVLGLLDAYSGGRESLPAFKEALDSLSASQDLQRLAAQEEERENRRLSVSFSVGITAAQAQTAAMVENTSKSQAAAIEAGKLADFQGTLASLGEAVAGGLQTSGAAALSLASKYGIAVGKAQDLIDLQAKIAGKPATEGRSERDTPQDRALGRTAGIQAGQARVAAIEKARVDQLLRTGSATQVITQRQREYNAAIAQYGKNSSQAIDAQTTLIEAQQAAVKARARAGGKGTSALDRSEIKLAGDERAQLATVNAELSKANLSALQRNQLEIQRAGLVEKIANEEERASRAVLDARLGAVQDAQARLKEAREAAGLQRQLQSGKFSGAQQEVARLRLEEISLEQQKRARAIADDVRTAGGAVGTPTAAVPTPRAQAGTAITVPLPLPNVAQLSPPSQAALNLSLTIQLDPVTGAATVVNPPPGVNVIDILVRSGKAGVP